MIKNHLRSAAVGTVAAVTILAGLGGVASASSISNTGPGSTNIIRGSYSGGSSIHTTGPGSTNYIGSGWKQKNNHYKKNHKVAYKKVAHQEHKSYSHKKCEPRNWVDWRTSDAWRKDCYHSYTWNDWDSWNNWKTCHDQVDSDSYDKTPHKVISWTHEDKDEGYVHGDKHDKDCEQEKPRVMGYNHDNWNKNSVENDNDITVNNHTYQHAESGDAKVSHNTYGGDATSGDAWNSSENNTEVEINNDWNGSNSHSYKVENSNSVSVSNHTGQSAHTGNATVSGNTYGGSATSGDASNYSSNTVSVSINN